jgi:hypothetical protein
MQALTTARSALAEQGRLVEALRSAEAKAAKASEVAAEEKRQAAEARSQRQAEESAHASTRRQLEELRAQQGSAASAQDAVVEQLRVELQAKGLEAARREEAAAKLQLVLEERIVYLTKEHEVQLAAVHEKHSGMLARVAASQEEAHAAALREQAVALAQREAESVQAVRDELDGLRRRLEEQCALPQRQAERVTRHGQPAIAAGLATADGRQRQRHGGGAAGRPLAEARTTFGLRRYPCRS